ncbi:hypothetical protein [Vagococcus salmoninarum]|uniref:hypothetical protein n=1 Tax=Vagococcus salmoninarum TaxID=2739 RepID=UPI003F9AFEA0
MLNIISVDEMPNEKQIDQAEQLLFLTMEVSKDYLINHDIEKKNLYQVLVASLYQSLKRNENFPDDEEGLKKIVNFVFTEYLSKGMPNESFEDNSEYFLLGFRIVMAMACDEEIISICDEIIG